MNVMRSYGYSKIEKEDPEDVIHRRAQFLIYKVLQKADSNQRSRPSFLRIRLCRLKVKIGRKLKKMRKTMLLSISARKTRVYQQIASQWKRLFGLRQTMSVLPSI